MSHYLRACSALNTIVNFFCITGTLFLILPYASAISITDFNSLLIYLAFVSMLPYLTQFIIFVFSHLLLLSRLSYSHLSEDFNATYTQCIYFTDIWDLLICLLDLVYPLHFIRAFISIWLSLVLNLIYIQWEFLTFQLSNYYFISRYQRAFMDIPIFL